MTTPLNSIPSYTRQLRQEQDAVRRRGRKAADASKLIGQKVGRLLAIDALPRDEKRHSRILCKCDCGEFSIVRSSDFSSGDSSSCKCLKTERFLAYQEQRAANLPASVVRDVFITSASVGNWPGSDLVVAKKHGLHHHRIRACVRRHQDTLLERYAEAIRQNPRIKRTHLDKSLHQAEFDWLKKAAMRSTAPQIDEPLGEISWDELSQEEQELYTRQAEAAAELADRLLQFPSERLEIVGTLELDGRELWFARAAAEKTVQNWMKPATAASFGMMAA